MEQINNFSSGQDGEILRDVVRTYQSHPLFVVENGLGRGILTRVLLVFARSVPEVGYCQGMNFVVGVLIVGRFADQGMDLDGDAASVWPKAGDISGNPPLPVPCALCLWVSGSVGCWLLGGIRVLRGHWVWHSASSCPVPRPPQPCCLVYSILSPHACCPSNAAA